MGTSQLMATAQGTWLGDLRVVRTRMRLESCLVSAGVGPRTSGFGFGKPSGCWLSNGLAPVTLSVGGRTGRSHRAVAAEVRPPNSKGPYPHLGARVPGQVVM